MNLENIMSNIIYTSVVGSIVGWGTGVALYAVSVWMWLGEVHKFIDFK